MKTNEIKCKINKDVSYEWHTLIDRKTENNNVILKVSPVFMNELQKKDSGLIDATSVLKDYCKLKEINWYDDFVYFSDKPKEVKTEELKEVKTDATNERIEQIIALINDGFKKKRKSEDIKTFLKAYCSDSEIESSFKVRADRKLQKTELPKELPKSFI